MRTKEFGTFLSLQPESHKDSVRAFRYPPKRGFLAFAESKQLKIKKPFIGNDKWLSGPEEDPSLLHQVHDSLECFGVVHGEVSKHLTVELDILFMKLTHEHGV